MPWRAMNRRRRERSRYAWLGVQATSSSLAVPDPVRLLMTAPDMLDSDALSRCANRPRDCCRGLATGQASQTVYPRCALTRSPPTNPHPAPLPSESGEGLQRRVRAPFQRTGRGVRVTRALRWASLISADEPLCFGEIRERSMAWKRLFGKNRDTADSSPPPAATPEPDGSGIMRRRPPAADPAMQSRLDALRQRRDMAAYDLERALAARQPENPWRERMELLDRSLATIEDDLRALDADPAAAPDFTSRDADHGHRGPAGRAGQRRLHDRTGTVSLGRGDRLGPARRARRARADSAALGKCRRARAARGPGPSDAKSWSGISPRAHRSSRSTCATAPSTASRYPSGRRWPIWPAPARCAGTGSIGAVTATPAPTRAYRRQTLRAEAARLAQERDDEEEDRHKWSERFPVARKRLADLDADIARLEAR